MKKILFILVILTVISYSEDVSTFTLSFTIPPLALVLSGVSYVFFNSELLERDNVIRNSNELTLEAISFSTGFNVSYYSDKLKISLDAIIPSFKPYEPTVETKYEAWFWGISPSVSFALLDTDTFKLLLDGNFRLNYFRKRKYVEPKGLYDEVYNYTGLGLTMALLGSDPELEEPDYYSWLFSQEVGYSWEGGLTGVSSIRWVNTGLFESFDESPFSSIGIDAIYSSEYVYLRYFIEFGWIL